MDTNALDGAKKTAVEKYAPGRSNAHDGPKKTFAEKALEESSDSKDHGKSK